MGKVIQLPRRRKLKINLKENSVIVGDCLYWLKEIPSNSIDMCYIDPPFFSNKTHEIIWGNGYERRSYEDRWRGGVKTYIVWMEERTKEIHRVLKPTGSILLHCDHHASHRLRVMLDDVFGEKNFINEIIWCYGSSENGSKKFHCKHDTIHWYGKNETKYTFNSCDILVKRKSTARYYTDSNGRKYTKKYGKVYYVKNEKKIPSDWWESINRLHHISKERIGYNTQKPEALLKRIIKACSNKNDIVLDCFGGGGTTASVAAQLNRQFIIGDVSPVAVRVISKRLNDLDAPPHFPF